MNTRVSDQAVACFAHGLGHLMCELGQEEGIRRAMHILVAMSDDEFLTDERIERRFPVGSSRPRVRSAVGPGG